MCARSFDGLFRKMLPAVLAVVVYLGMNLLAIRYMDERNGVVHGRLLPNSDHWPVARQIIDGERFTNFRYPPGFAIYIVAAVKAAEHWGGSYFLWRLMEDCLSTAVTGVLITALICRFTNSAWIIWGANILLMYNLAYSAGTATDLAMASFLPWFYGSLLLLIQDIQGEKSPYRAFVAGILLASSGFIRPDILLFFPFLALALWVTTFLQRTHLIATTSVASMPSMSRSFFVAFIGFGVILIPWVIFASVRSGAIVVYSTGFIPSHIDGLSQFPGNPVSESFHRAMWDLKSVADVVAMHYGLVKKYPLDWLELWLQKLWQPWYASSSQRWNTILAAETLFMLPAVLYGAYLWRKQRGVDLAFVIALSTIAYFWLISIAVLSINRYMPPVYPFLGMFVGFVAQVQWPQIFPGRKPLVWPSDGMNLLVKEPNNKRLM